MKSQIHSHLVKKLEWKPAPAGLYPFENMFWMEGKKDMEGFGACFGFTFVKEPCVFHPTEGMLIHPYDEVLVFASTDTNDIVDLGADISIEIGEERELYTFSKTYVVCLPKGTPHGPVKVTNVKKPFAHFVITLDPVYSAQKIPASKLKPPVPGSKKYEGYAHLMAMTDIPEQIGNPKYEESDGSGMGYNKVVDDQGVAHPQARQGADGMGPGNADSLIWLYGKDLLGFNLNFLWGHYSHPGVWHRLGESHSHPSEEILIHTGLDADHPFEIGACIEIAMGEEDERYACTEPTVFIQPGGFSHLPQTTRWVDKPYSFIVVCLDGKHDSPWKARDGSKNMYEE
jgi:hypothetical protein